MHIWPRTAYSDYAVPEMLAVVCDDCTTHSANYPWNLLPSTNVYRSSKLCKVKNSFLCFNSNNCVKYCLFVHSFKKFKCIITIAPSLRMAMKKMLNTPEQNGHDLLRNDVQRAILLNYFT